MAVHYGDICNLGIYCDRSSTGNRSLFENNTVYANQDGLMRLMTPMITRQMRREVAQHGNLRPSSSARPDLTAARDVV